MCESTTTSQIALQNDKYQFPGAVMPFQSEERSIILEDNFNKEDLNDKPYVYCTDEVTFYSPNMDMNYDDTEAEEEKELIINNDDSEKAELSMEQDYGNVSLRNRPPTDSFTNNDLCKSCSPNLEGGNLTSQAITSQGNH